MFRRILVPLDGSAFAEAALPTAFTLARKNNGEIRLLCVLEPVSAYPEAFEPPDDDWAKGYLAEASKRAEQAWDGTLTTAVRNGHPAEEIEAEAAGWGADVTVLATHGRGGMSRAWMGSVTDHFIRTATRPVLAVHPPESGTSEAEGALAMGRVVVPLDGSPLAEAALPFAESLAKQFGVPLVLIWAVPLPRVPDLSYLPDEIDFSNHAGHYLKEHLDRLHGDGVKATEVVVGDNRAAHAILSEAGSDLVVMSTHGRAGFDRAFFGSVADKVVRGASGPVMVIHPGAHLQHGVKSRTATALPERAAGPPTAATVPPWHRDRRLLASVMVVTALAAWGWLRPQPVLQPARVVADFGEINLRNQNEIVISPDGSRLAVAGTLDGQEGLYWRDAGGGDFRLIPGTEGDVRFVSFSPDAEWLVYSVGRALLKVAISGGAPRTVVQSGDVPGNARDNHWGDDGTIVFAGTVAGTGLYRVPDTGGEAEVLLESTEVRNPRLLPGGQSVVFTDPSASSTYLLDLRTDSLIELIPGGIDAMYVETGHLLYADQAGTLWAVEFNVGRGEVVGDAVPVLDGLSVVLGWWARYSVSRSGTLVYEAGARGGGVGRSWISKATLSLSS